MRNFKNRMFKATWVAGGMTICFAILAVTGIIFMQGKIESRAEKPIEEVTAQSEGDRLLFKDMEEDQDIVREVCGKYGLDYDTAERMDMSEDMVHYWMALRYLQDDGDRDLLGIYSGMVDENIPFYILLADTNASSEEQAEKAVRDVCGENGLDAESLKVKDLTAEQLAEIEKRCYDMSDHPKD